MELAQIELKLDGEMFNTVVKKDVTPAEMAVYAAMHGEDCLADMQITGVNRERTVQEEIDRLDYIFQHENAKKIISDLYPGMSPRIPVTFLSIGYDPNMFIRGPRAQDLPPQHDPAAAAELQEKIKGLNKPVTGTPAPVTQEEISAIKEKSNGGTPQAAAQS